jgi:hypothetical protein
MIPRFSAEAALFPTRNRYGSTPAIDGAGQSVVLARHPTTTNASCNTCLGSCARSLGICSALAAAPLAGCIFLPACPAAIAIAAAAQATCNLTSWGCITDCAISDDCCPNSCGIPNPFSPGDNCCDKGESCVAIDDPNARQGCCPRGQIVCSGKCCEKDEFCCNGACCPGNMFCIDGACTYPSFGPYTPSPPDPVRPPVGPQGTCPSGYFRCRDECCSSDMNCCGYGCQYGHCIN